MAAELPLFELEREELEAVLASGHLDRNTNLGKLLHYLCEKHFTGADEEIKEYNIALDVFDRSQDFDRRRDSIVRVEASRLRKRLDEFYANGGRSHRLRITIPPGQYAPKFVSNETPELTAAANHDLANVSWIRSIIAVALVLCAGSLIVWRFPRGSAASASAEPNVSQIASPAPVGVGEEVRILAGYLKDRYVDRLGRVWLGDRYFQGGWEVVPDQRQTLRSGDPDLYQTSRAGSVFTYKIPLKPGTYELYLYFCETKYGPSLPAGGGENSRVMNVSANGRRILSAFDPYTDAGGDHIGDVRAFSDISPGPDGMLHLRFDSVNDYAFVNAIELRPGTRGRFAPIRLVARDGFYTDGEGRIWMPDTPVTGGRLQMFNQPVGGSADPDLHLGERFGRFAYSIPVPPGRYSVSLNFAEHYFREGGAGQRTFDVLANGVLLLDDFDISREAGGPMRAVRRTFHGISPSPQGKIELAFLPVRNYAAVNAVEITQEQ